MRFLIALSFVATVITQDGGSSSTPFQPATEGAFQPPPDEYTGFTWPECGEQAHPRYSQNVACGLGRCPVSKYNGKCPACRQPIESGIHNIANTNNAWFHKRCAVEVIHPRVYNQDTLLARIEQITKDAVFHHIMTNFFTLTGHVMLSCSPGAGKTTVAAMISMATNPNNVLNLMYNRHNVNDAITKGICQSYTYHSITCSAILRYLRTGTHTKQCAYAWFARLPKQTLSQHNASAQLEAMLP